MCHFKFMWRKRNQSHPKLIQNHHKQCLLYQNQPLWFLRKYLFKKVLVNDLYVSRSSSVHVSVSFCPLISHNLMGKTSGALLNYCVCPVSSSCFCVQNSFKFRFKSFFTGMTNINICTAKLL